MAEGSATSIAAKPPHASPDQPPGSLAMPGATIGTPSRGSKGHRRGAGRQGRIHHERRRRKSKKVQERPGGCCSKARPACPCPVFPGVPPSFATLGLTLDFLRGESCLASPALRSDPTPPRDTVLCRSLTGARTFRP